MNERVPSIDLDPLIPPDEFAEILADRTVTGQAYLTLDKFPH
jgi:hypothetical protein